MSSASSACQPCRPGVRSSRRAQPDRDLVGEQPAPQREDGATVPPVDEVGELGRVGERRSSGTPSRVRRASWSASSSRSAVVSRSAARDGVAAGADPSDVALRGGDVGEAPPGEVAVRRASEAEVVALPPAGEVVPALVARRGPVRDLVPGQPGGAEFLVDEGVASRLDVVVGVAARIPAERRPGLDGEGVGARRAAARARGTNRPSSVAARSLSVSPTDP